MSESGEGAPIPEESKNPKDEFNEFGEIVSGQPTYKTLETPANQNLAPLKTGITKSEPGAAMSGEVGPVTDEARNAKPAATFEKTEEVVRKQTTPLGQALNRYANPAPQTGQKVDRKV